MDLTVYTGFHQTSRYAPFLFSDSVDSPWFTDPISPSCQTSPPLLGHKRPFYHRCDP